MVDCDITCIDTDRDQFIIETIGTNEAFTGGGVACDVACNCFALHIVNFRSDTKSLIGSGGVSTSSCRRIGFARTDDDRTRATVSTQ